MSMFELTEQAGAPSAPATDNGKKTVRVFGVDDSGAPGTTVLGSIDSDSNVGDFKGPQGDIGATGATGPIGPPGTLAVQFVADINNPTEIESLTLSGTGSDIIAHQNIGAGTADVAAMYAYDTDGPAKNAPFVMNTGDGGTTRWVANGGRFFNNPINSVGNINNRNMATDGTKLDSIATGAQINTKEKFFSPGTDTANQDNYSVRTAGATAQSFFAFHIPHDFVSLVSLQAIYFNSSTLVAVDIDLNSSYGALGEDRINHQESDIATTYSSNANQLSALDISTVFSSIAANDFCGLHIDHNAIGATQKYLGILLRYN